MEFTFFHIDTFTKQPFTGNPAAVVLQNAWLDETLMQHIASELNLSETAFVVPVDKADKHYAIRWFTPTCEVELCGHATLASAHVLTNHSAIKGDQLRFDSASGPLIARARDNGQIELDFPAQPHSLIETSAELVIALAAQPQHVLATEKRLLAVFPQAADVAALKPDMQALLKIPQYGICCAALGDGDYSAFDFICRVFAPKAGIPEDPVTGSAYTGLAPYFAEIMGKSAFSARQISQRGGNLDVALHGDRVTIAGDAVTVIEGTFRC